MDQQVALKRYVVRYEGRVQGVGFRCNAVRQSTGLSLNGFVCNQPDGSVLMDVEGNALDVKDLLTRIEIEMRGNIEAVQMDEQPIVGNTGGFKIQY